VTLEAISNKFCTIGPDWLTTSNLAKHTTMSAAEQLHPEYITDREGNRKSVILPIDEYEQLLEDLEDMAAIAERRNEPAMSHEDFLEELKADGLLPN
jgi:hypothetical protein